MRRAARWLGHPATAPLLIVVLIGARPGLARLLHELDEAMVVEREVTLELDPARFRPNPLARDGTRRQPGPEASREVERNAQKVMARTTASSSLLIGLEGNHSAVASWAAAAVNSINDLTASPPQREDWRQRILRIFAKVARISAAMALDFVSAVFAATFALSLRDEVCWRNS